MSAKPPDPAPLATPEPPRLPTANEFSPRQVKLRVLLALIETGRKDRDAIAESVRQRFYKHSVKKQKNPEKRRAIQRTRAYNALLGAEQYGLAEGEQTQLTALGKKLLKTPSDEEMYRLLARQIIRNRHGLKVLVAVREMQEGGLKVNKQSLQVHLEQHWGFDLPRGTLHHLKLLQWLRETDVLPKRGYEVSASAVEKISGLSLEDAELWAELTAEQKAFLRALRKIALLEGERDVPAKVVVDAAIAEFGPIFKRTDRLAATVFKPLADPVVGWIRHTAPKGGRGGKSGTVAATKKLLAAEVDLLPEGEGFGIPPDLKAKLLTPLQQVYVDLKSTETHVKGVALELLALRMAIDLSLVPTRLRLRSVKTGGAEVDLVAEAATYLQFTRWLIQCKNTRSVRVSDIAKEVGMAALLKANVIVLVTTGTFTPAVETYATEVASSTDLQVVLVEKKALARYEKGGAGALWEHFRKAARSTRTIKRAQVASEVVDS
jgi:hypothetical protein